MAMTRIPETREAIAQMFELYNMSGNPDDFKQLTDLENTKAHILIRISEPENDIIKSVTDKDFRTDSEYSGRSKCRRICSNHV